MATNLEPTWDSSFENDELGCLFLVLDVEEWTTQTAMNFSLDIFESNEDELCGRKIFSLIGDLKGVNLKKETVRRWGLGENAVNIDKNFEGMSVSFQIIPGC